MADFRTPFYSCLDQKEEAGRWFFARDMNCDGVFTISDVWLWAEWVFFLPGDWLLRVIMKNSETAMFFERVYTFFEIAPVVYGGWFSGIISAIAWLIAIGIWDAVVEWRGP